MRDERASGRTRQEIATKKSEGLVCQSQGRKKKGLRREKELFGGG